MSKHKKAPALVPAAPTDEASRNEPTLEEISIRAYEAYIERGRKDGFDLEDWLRAEKELKQNNKSTD